MPTISKSYKLAIIGAGPKGTAIWAKRIALVKAGARVPDIAIVDGSSVAANWSGQHGYTDGLQYLVTPAEQDIGYPYLSSWGIRSESVNDNMSMVSWYKYLITNTLFAEWVITDRKCSHQELTKYLGWVAKKTQLSNNLIRRDVLSIELADDGWHLRLSKDSSFETKALVVTGNGNPIKIHNQPEHPSILDGKSFWKQFPNLVSQSGLLFGIIGAGETAGAIAVALLERMPRNTQVSLIYDQPAFYSRGRSFGEIKWFSNPESVIGNHSWTDLSEEDRRDIIGRTDRGVVSVDIKYKLEGTVQAKHFIGRTRAIQQAGNEFALSLSYKRHSIGHPYLYSHVIVALGFDHLWFLDLCDRAARELIIRQLLKVAQPEDLAKLLKNRSSVTSRNATTRLDQLANSLSATRGSLQVPIIRSTLKNLLERSMGKDLSIRGLTPKLYLPMLSGLSQGPGFPNLNCLGLMSDRILRDYVNW